MGVADRTGGGKRSRWPHVAFDTNNFFFSQTTLGGTLFLKAPPIWQQIHAKVCADGTISSAAVVDNADEPPQRTIADQS